MLQRVHLRSKRGDLLFRHSLLFQPGSDSAVPAPIQKLVYLPHRDYITSTLYAWPDYHHAQITFLVAQPGHIAGGSIETVMPGWLETPSTSTATATSPVGASLGNKTLICCRPANPGAWPA